MARERVEHSEEKELREIDELRILHEAEIMRGEVMAKMAKQVGGFVRSRVRRVYRAIEQAQMMRALSALDDRMLRDIGVQRGDIPAYAMRMWDAKDVDAAGEAPQAEAAPKVSVEQRKAA